MESTTQQQQFDFIAQRRADEIARIRSRRADRRDHRQGLRARERSALASMQGRRERERPESPSVDDEKDEVNMTDGDIASDWEAVTNAGVMSEGLSGRASG